MRERRTLIDWTDIGPHKRTALTDAGNVYVITERADDRYLLVAEVAGDLYNFVGTRVAMEDRADELEVQAGVS